MIRGRDLPPFSRDFWGSGEPLTVLGEGPIGGKAAGLLRSRDMLAARFPGGEAPPFRISIPTLTVICSDVFDAFVERNELADLAESGASDPRIARAFQDAALPGEWVGDLRGLIERTRSPLAIRSSSVLEDALHEPFAGVYETKMVPNNQLGPDQRFQRLVEAIKLVYASTFFRPAREYIKATSRDPREERMAVVIQEVVGARHGTRFYPDLSGVVRSHNYYAMGRGRPEDGVASLALGLGKTIVDGGRCWTYSPARPRVPPPFASAAARLRETQDTFWAVNMGEPPAYDPLAETEYLLHEPLTAAEEDGALRLLASTYDPASDRLLPGTGARGPRVLDFAPLLDLELLPLNRAVRELLAAGEASLGGPVEIEFAATLTAAGPGPDGPPLPPRIGFLQVRALAVSQRPVEVTEADLASPLALLASSRAMGNGEETGVRDVVYLVPERFETRHTAAIAAEVETMNAALRDAGRGYLLAGFGRWGSSDPWLGVPVRWDQISAARAIVESALPGFSADPSQGSHFFHNVTSFRVFYFSVPEGGPSRLDWRWLASLPAAREGRFARHVELPAPLLIKVDGRTGRGVALRRESPGSPHDA